ncbi:MULTISPECIES: hypothetical protein [unclassified Halomonas]|uniref:hypothetical protein n=1 Tax=unclassified Halomonas TaxID=2609666 RepID=UPI002885984F|nr:MULTISPECIES: hypothetical protein [unclassified Halomonas]MDT0502339.1 hypothetical protein [Halomonas sp. PAR7]MDT0511724.1 hypothetical protein [Halomonas sp. LES1]MDT0592057.1 hypothetical protein [Halomonas sp. PAR8]
MESNNFDAPNYFDNGLSRLYRTHAVELQAMQSEIKTLVIIAGHARDCITEGLEDLPEEFFICIEEMKEVMESIDIKSLDFEKRALTLQRTKRRLEAKANHQKPQKED